MTTNTRQYNTPVWLVDDCVCPNALLKMTLGEIVDAYMPELLHRPFLERLDAAEYVDILPCMWWDEESAIEGIQIWNNQ